METTSAMGILYEHLGDYERAIACYDREMELAQQVGVLAAQGRSLANKASALWGSGELEQALNTFTEALKIFERVGYRRARLIVRE